MLRIGQGYDLHPLVKGRPFVLGGITIPAEFGPAGHSDGDALCHALIDALFGALAAGDIGTHFPDTDPQWKGADSRKLLEMAYREVTTKGYELVNLDATILLERPKLRPHIPAMRETLAQIFHCRIDQVSIKAKTNEKLDAVGRGAAVAATVVCLLQRKA